MSELNEGRFEFQDKNNKTWDCKITLTEALRIDDSDYSELTDVEISFLAPSPETQKALFTNAPLMFAVIYTILKTQMKREGTDLTQDEFCNLIDGGCIWDAQRAFLRSLTDFFRGSEIVLSPMIEAAEKMIENMKGNREEDAAMIQEEVDKLVAAEEEKYRKAKENFLEKRSMTQESETAGIPSTQ